MFGDRRVGESDQERALVPHYGTQEGASLARRLIRTGIELMKEQGGIGWVRRQQWSGDRELEYKD